VFGKCLLRRHASLFGIVQGDHLATIACGRFCCEIGAAHAGQPDEKSKGMLEICHLISPLAHAAPETAVFNVVDYEMRMGREVPLDLPSAEFVFDLGMDQEASVFRLIDLVFVDFGRVSDLGDVHDCLFGCCGGAYIGAGWLLGA